LVGGIANKSRFEKLARWAHYSAIQVMHGGLIERRLTRVNKLCALLADHRGLVTLGNLEMIHGLKPDEVERLAADFPLQLRLKKGDRIPRAARRVAS
jgi:hypothetical protein